MKTVVGLFDDMAQAKTAALDLEKAGIPHDDISLVANNEGGKYATADGTTDGDTTTTGHAIGKDALVGAEIGGVAGLLIGLTGFAIPGFGWIAGAGWLMSMLIGAGTGAVIGGLVGALTSVGVPEEDATHYSEGVRRGGVLLAVKAQDNIANEAARILSDDGAVNIDERAEQYSQEGVSPTAVNPVPMTATPGTATPVTPVSTTRESIPATTTVARDRDINDKTVIPVVEEDLEVGKRQVQRGGVRVYTHVTQEPVQEQVTLREEHVNVDRRPVDRPITAADEAAFKEQSFEVTERAEEAVIAKQARVVEEVIVGKEATERRETVQDTVRRTEVDVQPIAGSEHVSRTRTYDILVPEFRNDYQTNYGSLGGNFEQYQPAYRYGYELWDNPTYRGRDWASIEPNIRTEWESRQPNTWDRFKNAIRFAWSRASSAGSAVGASTQSVR